MEFSNKDIEKISSVLGISAFKENQAYRWKIENQESGRTLTLELYKNIPIGKSRGNLVSVYTRSTHLQLHFVSGYVVSEMLGEVTFVGANEGHLSGLIIEREAACSLYANVDDQLLSGDFTKLGPEVMLSGIALSLAEEVLPSTRKKIKGTTKRKGKLKKNK